MGAWQRQARRERQLSDEKQLFAAQVEAAARAARADHQAFLGWEGERELRISAIVDEATDVKSFYLTHPEGHSLPSFEPGQYLTCHLPTPAGEKRLVRCYSLSDRPHQEYYRLTVKQCAPPAGQPDLPAGRASSQLHQMQVGDSLQVAAPRGRFFLDPRNQTPLVLVAGGIGITPIVSMLAALVHEGDAREIYCFLGVRNSAEHPLREPLEEIAHDRPNLHLFVAYSQPLPTDQPFTDYQHSGRITIDYLQQVVPTGQFDYYLCGPGGMMESLVEGLLDQGVPEEQVYFEAFGPASVRRKKRALVSSTADNNSIENDDFSSNEIDLNQSPFTLHFTQSQQKEIWDPQCESLLEMIESAGIAIDSGCRAGSCRMCETRVLEGEIVTLRPPSTPPSDGHCYACISLPASSVTLEL